MALGHVVYGLASLGYTQDDIARMTPYFAYFVAIQALGYSVLVEENHFSAKLSEAEKKVLGYT